MQKNMFALILAGGSGSRLWPLSRELYPKQLLKLNNSEKTLLQMSVERLKGLIPDEHILSITNIKHLANVRAQISQVANTSDTSFIVEPVGCNTAPAIALGAKFIQKFFDFSEDPVILVCPSDHFISDSAKFRKMLSDGAELAEKGFIVTFGVKPTSPDTGYGYIKVLNEKVSESYRVDTFKEKPDYALAKEYFESGNYFWNAGIFMFKASTILNELKKYSPDVVDVLEKLTIKPESPSVKFDDYAKMPNISIDYAVMEYSKNIVLLPMDCGWNDVGSWESIYDMSEKDANKNYISGNVIELDCKNSMFYSTSKLISAIGLENVVIVETEDAILACDKSKTQEVKKIYSQLKDNDDPLCSYHKTVYRPWGYYTVLNEGEGFLTKVIQVNTDAKLSLQLHNHRSEHWVVLEGRAKVIKGEEEFILEAGDSIDIAVKEKHSLQNPFEKPLKILEVQKGDIISEEDIIRFEDMYGRVNA